MTFPHNTSILKLRFEIQKYSGVTSFSIIPQFNIWLSKERVWHCREMMSCFRSTTLHTSLAEWIHNKWRTLWRFKCILCFAYKMKSLSKHSNEHVYGLILLNKVENGNRILIRIFYYYYYHKCLWDTKYWACCKIHKICFFSGQMTDLALINN